MTEPVPIQLVVASKGPIPIAIIQAESAPAGVLTGPLRGAPGLAGLVMGATISLPVVADNLTISRTKAEVTITEARAMLIGAGSASVELRTAPDREQIGTLVAAGAASTGTGTLLTLTNPTVPAGHWVWIVVTDRTGAVDSLSISVS